MLHLDGSGHLLPAPGADVTLDGRTVGTVTTVARHHELGPIALAVLKRSVPEDAELLVDCDGGAISAAQETVVPGEGVSADRPAPRGEVARGLTPRGEGAPTSML
jgi:folate-binding Fe-S cluster repair protein YgfZ